MRWRPLCRLFPSFNIPLYQLPLHKLPFPQLPLIALLTFIAASTKSEAQTDPRGAYRTIRTSHIALHYPKALDSLARLAAVHAERAYGQLSVELAPPRGVIDVLLTDNTDVSNGYATIFPSNRVVVYAVPPLNSRELRFHDDWLRMVITHELAHVFHIDRARGVWRVGRALFGRNPLFFPNAFTPSWVKEGLAVHYESALTGSGRVVSTEFPAMLRAAALDSALIPFGRWSLSTSRWPRGQTAYGYGTMLMDRAVRVAERGVVEHEVEPGVPKSDTVLGMKRFVETTARQLIPFRLNRNARVGFGATFASMWRGYVDSLLTQRTAEESRGTGNGGWRQVSRDGWYAESPRWLGNDSLVWSASTGREVTGLYVAPVNGGDARRVAWRNALDVNVPVDSSLSRVVFAQLERRDPYVVRSDLYVREGAHERRLTYGARLTQPDVRRDGRIVAVQLGANASRLVTLAVNDTRVAALTPWRTGEKWAEPRWSPDGREVVAVQLVPGGVQRIVIVGDNGALRRIVSGQRGVFASPSFAPSGDRLVWASDRSGRMQIETASRGAVDVIDTVSWQRLTGVTQLAPSAYAVYDPSVSPDGKQVVALVQRGDGFHVAVAPLDSAGALVRSMWYSPWLEEPDYEDSLKVIYTPDTKYAPLRQLLPRYWLPLVGEGRLGDATIGASTSGVDILERHAWDVSVLSATSRRETDAFASYRYAGLGVPVADFGFSQEWDGTFRVVNDSGTSLGTVARRRRFVSAGLTTVVPRVRWSFTNAVGAQYEVRDFTAAADSILGPANSLLRSGTRYPSMFVTNSVSTARLALRGVSIEEGITLSYTVQYRWRSNGVDGGTSTTGSWRSVASMRGYLPLPLPGYARHVLAARVVSGETDSRTQSEFSVGGTSGVASDLLPGVRVGDPARAFPVRGVAPGVQRGARALGGTLEYRAPLLMFRRLPGPFTLYGDRLSIALFSDAARAWCPASMRSNTVICQPRGVRDGIIASAGGELVLDVAVQYDVPYRLRIGAAAPYAAPAGVSRSGAFYVTLGGYF